METFFLNRIDPVSCWIESGGERIEVVQPHRHSAVLGTLHNATRADTRAAIANGLAISRTKQVARPWRKHGVYPV